ncbi:protein virilizer [Anopheles ziemanni]|uniref:protein virilizer n=1 Tax=Anopheles ziemanni TaxID=345580 RepID=UPI00265E1C1E|nr:protein virilizer [Anopheles ziemanni]
MTDDLPELLFFDTFSHDGYEQNLDLVQFPKPVFITEVRIIPLGARVHADFPGGVRLGATNPSNFNIELFVNDLSKPGAPVFESLGGLDYNQNNCIHLECGIGYGEEFVRRIPTDGLVLKGWYTTLTLAVYGILTTNIAEPIVSPRETTPQPNELLNTIVVHDHHHHHRVHAGDVMVIGGVGGGIAEPGCVGDWIQEPPMIQPNETVFVQKEYPDDDSEDAPKDPRPYARRVAAAAAAATIVASAASPPEPIYEPLEAGKILPGEDLIPEKRSKCHGIGSGRSVDHQIHPSQYVYDLSPRVRRHSSREEFSSRSPSLCKEYGPVPGKQQHSRDQWSRSPECVEPAHPPLPPSSSHRSRRLRSDSFERLRREPSFERHDKESRRRPHSPLESPLRPRSPDRNESSPDEDDDMDGSFDRGSFRRSIMVDSADSLAQTLKHAPTAAGSSVRSICVTPVASPTTSVPMQPEEDNVSVTEQFEPILSDEEIPEDFDFEMDDYDFADEYGKQFNPYTAVLARYERAEDPFGRLGSVEQKMIKTVEHLLGQNRYSRAATNDFLNESAEWKERFVDYAEQLVHSFHQLLAKDEARDAFQHLLERWIAAGWCGVDNLINCIRVGLDFERAMGQVQPAYKLRHMKSAIRLAEFLGPYESFMRLVLAQDDFNLFDRFLGLYSQHYMALSIKLIIIRSMYACLDTRYALHYFLSPSYNGFQILLDLVKENPSTRISFSLKSLMRKIMLYENLELIHATVMKLYDTVDESNEHLDKECVDLLEECLTELTKTITLNEILLSQPKRFLPVSAKFEIHKDIASSINVHRTLVHFFKIHKLVESITLLLDLNITPPSLCEIVFNLIACMLKNLPKLRYLADCIPFTNVLLKWLFAYQPAGAGSGTEGESTLSSNPDVYLPADSNRSQLLGLEMAYKLQALYHLDAMGSTKMLSLRGSGCNLLQNVDELALERDIVVESLQSLYHLACGSGKRYVVEVLLMEQNLALLLDLVEVEKRTLSKEDCTSPSVKHKSPIISYCIDLLDIVVRFAEAVSYLAQHGAALLNLVKQHEQFEPSVSATLQELAVYLKPLELHDLFSYVDIAPLVELMKRSLEYVTSFPGDLITALRLVRLLGIPPYDDYDQPMGHAEFKFKYTLLQFYSTDGQAMLMSILEKLNHYFDQPAIHASSLASHQGVLLTQMLSPLVYILRKLVTDLIECRNTEFRDLTLIEPLLRTYALMQSVPTTAPASADARQVQKEIIRILLAYTQPTPAEGLDTNNIHRSLWTQMVGELVRFTLSGPNYFIPGLLVFSELLPVPLPIQCRQVPTHAEIGMIIKERQLWSAHLHPQSLAIGELIQTICTSSYTPLLVILNRVCLQLSDLAPNMTLLISKSIADLIVHEPLLPGGLSSTSHARLLSFLSSLACHPSVKISVLSILPGRIMDMLMGVLLEPGQTPAHQQTQEHIYLVFQNLFDSEIALMFGPSIDPALQLACSLPPKDIIELFCATCAENVSNVDIGVGVLMAAVRTMILLTENDTTFVSMLSNLMRKRDGWCTVLRKFVRKAKDNPEQYRPLFALLSEFWRLLATIEDSTDASALKRTVKLPITQLKLLLPIGDVRQEEGDEDLRPALLHIEDMLVLFKADKTLKQLLLSREENTNVRGINDIDNDEPVGRSPMADELPSLAADNLASNLAFLYEKLLATTNNHDAETESNCTPDWSTVAVDPLPQAEGIVTQYGSRNVYVLSEDCDDQLKLNYWLGFAPCDDDLQREQIPCDLQDLAKMCLSGETNLTADCKRLLHLSASPHSNRDRLTTAPCFRTRRVEVEPSTGRPEKKIFATPLRGRGFSRAPTTRGDLFRSRPPNTSRPPSLHVDDFLALETCGAQPTGPTGYNKLSRDIITIRGSNRSRGRNYSDRGRSGVGGGNVSSVGSGAGHWQNGAGGCSGGNGGGGLGSSSGWSSSNSSQMHESGGSSLGAAGKHFGHGGTGNNSHYRDTNHFGGSQRSRSGRGFRYSSRIYTRQM